MPRHSKVFPTRRTAAMELQNIRHGPDAPWGVVIRYAYKCESLCNCVHLTCARTNPGGRRTPPGDCDADAADATVVEDKSTTFVSPMACVLSRISAMPPSSPCFVFLFLFSFSEVKGSVKVAE